MAIVVVNILLAGCMQSPGTGPVIPAVPATILPVEAATPAPIATATVTPQEVATIVHQVSQVRDIRDSELLFALQVPEEWNVTTYRISNSATSEGLMYQTDLVENNTFFINTYAITRGQDQAYRDECRMWSPAPVETTVTINGITYDRFESTSGEKTNVSYVVRKGSANERGYASVLFFTANTSNRFEKEDYEKVVSSFRYFSGENAGTIPGTEIARIAPPLNPSGGTLSAKGGSSDSGSGSSGGCGCRG